MTPLRFAAGNFQLNYNNILWVIKVKKIKMEQAVSTIKVSKQNERS